MHIAGGATAAYKREIESADDPAAKLQEIEDQAQRARFAVPDGRGDRPGHHRPRETRPMLAESVIEAQRILASRLGPPSMPYLP